MVFRNLSGLFKGLLGNRNFQALFFLPLVGAFLFLIFGIFMVGKGKGLQDSYRRALALQLFVPAVFGLLSFLRWLMWIGSFGFDSEGIVFKVLIGGNQALFYVAGAWLLVCYLGMMVNAIAVIKGNEFGFPLIENLIGKFQGKLVG